MSRTRDSSSALRRAATTTFALARANSFAVARPIPELAPVTIATLPLRSIMLPSGFPRRIVGRVFVHRVGRPGTGDQDDDGLVAGHVVKTHPIHACPLVRQLHHRQLR